MLSLTVTALPPSTSSWLEFAKLVAGPFLGAGFAFLANRYFEQSRRKRENLAAANLALAIISRQWGDFVIFRAGFVDELTTRIHFAPWLRLKPSVFTLSEALTLDLHSLTFLFEHQRGKLLAALVDADLRYAELKNLVAQATAAAVKRDEFLCAAGLEGCTPAELRRCEQAVPAVLRGELQSLYLALGQRVNNSEPYQNAGRELYGVMRAEFKRGQVMTFTALGADRGLEDIQLPALWDQ